MASVSDWKVPSSVQPKAEDYSYDLDLALACMVSLRATVPADAFTAETLGTERAGNGAIVVDPQMRTNLADVFAARAVARAVAR